MEESETASCQCRHAAARCVLRARYAKCIAASRALAARCLKPLASDQRGHEGPRVTCCIGVTCVTVYEWVCSDSPIFFKNTIHFNIMFFPTI